MKLCRIDYGAGESNAFFFEDRVIPFDQTEPELSDITHDPQGILACLPGGKFHENALVANRVLQQALLDGEDAGFAPGKIDLLVPVANPPKMLFLAGNYSAHVMESGESAIERAETYPYVFWKPPSTTLNDPDGKFLLPRNSPGHLDWEVELGVIIGRWGKDIDEKDALDHVAGYTVVNDISDREFRPNPGRKERKRDGFFDWLHGKWHDSSCPMGPCILAASEDVDPQQFHLELKLNGEVRQDASTAQQVFPVAAVIAFISSFVTLQPGDVIATGTPAGVGRTTGTYLKSGDVLEASIGGIGILRTHVVAPSDQERPFHVE